MRAEDLTAEHLLRAYAAGIFPMADSRDDPDVFWVDPTERGILPLDGFHLSRSLKRRLRSDIYRPSLDRAFETVIDRCAARPETWINAPIRRLYADLHRIGHAHSLEVWQGDDLVGGVYGVRLGAAFFGESMFSARTDASKVALAYLIDRLKQSGFKLFDAQFLTDHLASLGAVEISRDAYRARLAKALQSAPSLSVSEPFSSGASLVQRITQTS